MPTLTRDPPGEQVRPPGGDAALAAAMTDEEMERGLEELKLQRAVPLALLDRPRGQVAILDAGKLWRFARSLEDLVRRDTAHGEAVARSLSGSTPSRGG